MIRYAPKCGGAGASMYIRSTNYRGSHATRSCVLRWILRCIFHAGGFPRAVEPLSLFGYYSSGGSTHERNLGFLRRRKHMAVRTRTIEIAGAAPEAVE